MRNEIKGGRRLGFHKESQAAAFLSKNGIEIVCRNYSTRFGEIDIIGRDGTILFFAEVKFRSATYAGDAEEVVDYFKQEKICRCADIYRSRNGYTDDHPFRYDVIAMSRGGIRWYKNAFDHIFIRKRYYRS